MLTLMVGRDASGNRSNRAPLSKRNSLTPSTVVTSVGGAAVAVSWSAMLVHSERLPIASPETARFDDIGDNPPRRLAMNNAETLLPLRICGTLFEPIENKNDVVV